MFFSVFYITRVMLNYFTSQHIPVDMSVDFRGSNRFMAQHTLYST